MAAAPILSELRIFPYGIVPKGWIPCNGQILPIAQNQALFALLQTIYGGNGVTTFAIPNLNGRVPMHRGFNQKSGSTLYLGETGGEQTHTLKIAEIPNHTHQAIASPFVPDRNTPENNFWTANQGFKPYGSQSDNPPMSSSALKEAGENAPHNNMAPFLVLNICMAIEGIFPGPNDPEIDGDPWTSEIRMFAGTLLPNFWVPCDGQTLPISKNSELFGLVGTLYGGDGISTVGMPGLQASAPLMAGQGNGLTHYDLGETGGTVTVTLTEAQVPLHTHAAMAKESGDEGEPEGRIWANPGSQPPLPPFFSSTLETDPQQMNAAAIGSTGGGGPHNNLMPFGVVTYCIATRGTNPPR
jgi:microcystin-dependent protein